MSTTLTITMNDGRQVETQQLAVPVLPSSVESLRGALPNLDEIATFVKDKPDVAAQMVRDYNAGRMDAVMATATDMGIVAERSASEGQAGAAAVVVLIIIAIILILLFPKPVKAPVKPPTRD